MRQISLDAICPPGWFEDKLVYMRQAVILLRRCSTAPTPTRRRWVWSLAADACARLAVGVSEGVKAKHKQRKSATMVWRAEKIWPRVSSLRPWRGVACRRRRWGRDGKRVPWWRDGPGVRDGMAKDRRRLAVWALGWLGH